MKKIVLIVLLIILYGCLNKTNYIELNDINYIKENKNNIEYVKVSKITNGSYDCYNVDKEKAYSAINDMKILKESNMSVTDDYMSYTFYYKDGTKTKISFEGPYLVENSKKYTSYTVEFNHVDLVEEDLTDCE